MASLEHRLRIFAIFRLNKIELNFINAVRRSFLSRQLYLYQNYLWSLKATILLALMYKQKRGRLKFIIHHRAANDGIYYR